jgi:multidrug efflux system outer membrane protein
VVAERRLHAQTARIGVAQALLFPQFDLTADLGATFNGGNNGVFGLGAQLFGPLFNAGANVARVDVERARTEQLLNSYEQTILSAYREVSDAMIEVRTYEAEYDFRRQQLEAATNAEKLAWVRYDGGKTNYLEVLDLQRSLFASQLTASETFQRRLTAFVRLYQALGGGWIEEEEEAPAEEPVTEGE